MNPERLLHNLCALKHLLLTILISRVSELDVLNSRGLGLLKCFLDFWSDLIGFTLCPISPY